jgi:hypothetical protein
MIEKVTIVQELNVLIQQQIQTLKQDKKIPDTDLRDYSMRSVRIHELYRSLDQAKNREFAGRHAA